MNIRFKKILPLFLAFLIGVQPLTMCANDWANELITPVFQIALPAVIGYVAIRFINWLMGDSNFSYFSSVEIKPVEVDQNMSNYSGPIPSDVENLLDQLKNPEKYRKMNVPLTKGILLYGDPGVGKTHLARCIAGEVRCPFFAIEGTFFAGPLFGESANKVRQCFSIVRLAAKKNFSKTAILFIDEFDALGSRGGKDLSGRSKFDGDIITTFLKEMDGFKQHNAVDSRSTSWLQRIFSNRNEMVNIVVIAATNYRDKLDGALIRSGRFDQQIRVPFPNEEVRGQLLRKYFEKSCADNIMHGLVILTKGMTPADMKVLFDEAGRDAIRADKSERDQESIVRALFKVRESQKSRKVASQAQRKKIINKFFDAIKRKGISPEALADCTEGMTTNDMGDMLLLFADHKGPALVRMAAASCVIENRIKRADALDKIEIAQTIYQVSDDAINQWKECVDLLELTPEVIINQCKMLASA